MEIIASANQKGGVGKTTSVVTLAGLLAKNGSRVLMVDIDPQCSLTCYFGFTPELLDATSYHLFPVPGGNIDAVDMLIPLEEKNLVLLPSSPAIATVEKQLFDQKGMGFVISSALKGLRSHFDYIFIDTPPALGILMINALAACDKLLVPVQTEYLALKGLERIIGSLEMMARIRKKPLDYMIVPTMVDRRTQASLRSLQALRDNYRRNIWSGSIPVDTKFREASLLGRPLANAFPSSRGAKAYEALWHDLTRTHPSHVESDALEMA